MASFFNSKTVFNIKKYREYAFNHIIFRIFIIAILKNIRQYLKECNSFNADITLPAQQHH